MEAAAQQGCVESLSGIAYGDGQLVKVGSVEGHLVVEMLSPRRRSGVACKLPRVRPLAKTKPENDLMTNQLRIESPPLKWNMRQRALTAERKLDFRSRSCHHELRKPGYYLLLLRTEIRNRSLRKTPLLSA
jgi:hypothetical protein